MKITYEVFEKHMRDIINRWRWEDEFHAICRKCPDKSFNMFIPSMISNLVNLLEYILDDKDEWISYFVYELDCGRRYKEGSVTNADGSLIPLVTIEDLWAILQLGE